MPKATVEVALAQVLRPDPADHRFPLRLLGVVQPVISAVALANDQPTVPVDPEGLLAAFAESQPRLTT
jgi:hypothetical protein